MFRLRKKLNFLKISDYLILYVLNYWVVGGIMNRVVIVMVWCLGLILI